MASTIGVQIAGPIVIGVLGGRYLDHRFGTEPWLMVACLFIGLAAGITGLMRMVQSIFEEEKKQ